MSQLTRVNQKIFGSTGGTGEFGKFGSDSLGAAATTKDIAQIQSLAPYLQGWFAATNNATEPPRIQDMNGLFLMLTTQLGYLFQNGIPEWEAGTSYYTLVSYCQRSGVIYRSKTDDNLNHDPATDDGTYWEAGDSFYRQLKWDLDTLGFTGYALYTDKYLADKLRIARREMVGGTVFSSFKVTPTAFGAAKSTANPSYPEYAPYIDRSVDQNISTTNYPLLASLRNVKASVKGVTDFAVTVSGSNVTFPNSPEGVAMVKKIINDATVAGWLNSGQTVDAPADYSTAETQMYLNVAGVDYSITGTTLGSRIIAVTGSPATGSQTAILYPFRNSSATGIRLRKLTGFVPVADGDADGENVNGLRKMWRMQGFKCGSQMLSYGYATSNRIDNTSGGGSWQLVTPFLDSPTPDGTNGTPLTGKTTDPRSFGQYVYTFAGVYI